MRVAETGEARRLDAPPPSAGPPPSAERRRAKMLIRAADVYREALFRVVNRLGPRFGYAFSAPLARGLYRTLTPLREQAEAHVRAARAWLGGDVDVARLARTAFVHRIWNLIDLMLAPRRLTREGLARFGGRLEPGLRQELHDARRRGQPVLLVTAYYGPFDLLPVLLGAQGLRMSVVYRPHANPAYDRLRQRVRELAGCEMIALPDALVRVPQRLDAGATVGLVFDHHSETRGIDTDFLGIPTRVAPTVGILAARHRADVVVAGVRRIGRRFRFEIVVTDVLKARDFGEDENDVRNITIRTVRGLETLVRGDPEQYNWVQERWGRIARQ